MLDRVSFLVVYVGSAALVAFMAAALSSPRVATYQCEPNSAPTAADDQCELAMTLAAYAGEAGVAAADGVSTAQ